MSKRAAITVGLSLLVAGLGVAVIVRTATLGGGSFGYLLGALFVCAGLLRLLLGERMRRAR